MSRRRRSPPVVKAAQSAPPPVIETPMTGLPSFTGSENTTVDMYVANIEHMAKGVGQPITPSESLNEILKAITAPPQMQSFARISYMPQMHNSGVMQWPGIPPEALKKVAKENLAPQLIINMRIDDVLRYSQLSNQPWKPGWRIYPRVNRDHVDKTVQADIHDAERFLMNGNIETDWSEARKRDAMGFTGMQRFLSMVVRDSLNFDGIAIWTDADAKGRVKAFKALPSAQIRMTGPKGYAAPNEASDPDIFAVAVDDAGNVINTFTRGQLIWYVRNPRTDPGVFGYGYSELEQGMRLIQGFTNALDMNVDAFNRNTTPNGMLLLTGKGWNQRQLDVVARIWTNLKSGNTKAWALPALMVPQDGKIEVLDLTDIRGKEAYYQDFMNMVVGAFCTLFRFPVTRLGYRISGKGQPTKPDGAAAEWIVDENDPGLSPLLHHIESVFNEYLLWTRWPHLEFCFTGKSPKEDAREYELRALAMTVDERRRQAGLAPMADDCPDDLKQLARIIGMTPTDPALTGVFQSMAAAFLGAGSNQKKDNAIFPHKNDPAASEDHGHMSGVRRHEPPTPPKEK